MSKIYFRGRRGAEAQVEFHKISAKSGERSVLTLGYLCLLHAGRTVKLIRLCLNTVSTKDVERDEQ